MYSLLIYIHTDTACFVASRARLTQREPRDAAGSVRRSACGARHDRRRGRRYRSARGRNGGQSRSCDKVEAANAGVRIVPPRTGVTADGLTDRNGPPREANGGVDAQSPQDGLSVDALFPAARRLRRRRRKPRGRRGQRARDISAVTPPSPPPYTRHTHTRPTECGIAGSGMRSPLWRVARRAAPL